MNSYSEWSKLAHNDDKECQKFLTDTYTILNDISLFIEKFMCDRGYFNDFTSYGAYDYYYRYCNRPDILPENMSTKEN